MLTPAEHHRLQQHVRHIDVTRMTTAFDALSEPNRCLIFRALLRGRPIRVGDIARLMDISDPLASQHLKVLRQAELVIRERDGKHVYYRVNHRNPMVEALERAVDA